MQDGDVNQTFADISSIIKNYQYQPNTSIKEGIKEFIIWYSNYYNKL